MRLLQSQERIQHHALAVLAELASVFVARLTRSPGAEAHVVLDCEGYAWCDSLERQVITDTAACQRARL